MDNKFFLREKRCEYILKLEDIVTTSFLNTYLEIYSQSKKECKQGKNVLKEFQTSLRNIKEWDEKDLKKLLKRFREESKCEFIEKLIQSIFKIYYLTNGIKEAQFPSVLKYIHECLLNIARQLYKNPYLLYEASISAIERRKNIHKIESIIRKCIGDTFVQMLPFSPIDVYENSDNSDDDEDSDEDVPGENEAAETDSDDKGRQSEEKNSEEESDEGDEEGDEDDEDDGEEGDEEEEDEDDEEEEEGDEDDEDDGEEGDEEEGEGDEEEGDEEEGDEEEGDEEEGDDEEGDEDDEDDGEEGDEDDEDDEEEGDDEVEEEGDEDEDEVVEVKDKLVEINEVNNKNTSKGITENISDVKVISIDEDRRKRKEEKITMIKEKFQKKQTDSFF